MGALTELADRRNRKEGYCIAATIYRKYKDRALHMTRENKIKLVKKIIEDYKGEPYSYDIECNLEYFFNIEIKSYFFLYEWTFAGYPDSIDMMKHAAEKNGFIVIERLSTDNDFFLFHPKNHSLGLELRDPENRCPYDMNVIFGKIPCNREFGRFYFGY